jgi:hypothetical protein
MNAGNESGTSSVTERERKRTRFVDESTARSNKKRSTMLVAGVAAAIVIASAFFLLNGGDTSTSVNRSGSSASAPATARSGAPSGASAASATALSPEGDVFRIPTASITSEATFFKGNAGTASVPFFVVRDASGRVHVALDACQACASAKKGYTQAGDHMQCRNCGMTFDIAQITDMADRGGCHPIVLPSAAAGDSIVIKSRDVAAGAKWF